MRLIVDIEATEGELRSVLATFLTQFSVRRQIENIARVGRVEMEIACPHCGQSPTEGEEWDCANCGYSWNTFNTRGMCPGCGRQWLETQCHSCGRWAAHHEWYRSIIRVW